MHGSGLRCTEPPGLKVDFVLVLRVRAFSVDAVNFQKIIYLCHVTPPERLVNVVGPQYNYENLSATYFRAEAGRSATRRSETDSSSSWKCGFKNAIARYAPGFPGIS